MSKRLDELERRIEALENKTIQRPKMDEVANWILSKFDTKRNEITVRRIYELGAQKGYKYQTLQLARRHLLDDKIGLEHRKGKGWLWVRIKPV